MFTPRPVSTSSTACVSRLSSTRQCYASMAACRRHSIRSTRSRCRSTNRDSYAHHLSLLLNCLSYNIRPNSNCPNPDVPPLFQCLFLHLSHLLPSYVLLCLVPCSASAHPLLTTNEAECSVCSIPTGSWSHHGATTRGANVRSHVVGSG